MARSIFYKFEFESGECWSYKFEFDDKNQLIPRIQTDVKAWTALEYGQCKNCPLRKEESPQCPVAANLDPVIEDSKETLSITKSTVTVETKERIYSKQCATQEGLRSLFGLVMASSGCPHLNWLRPLARFHLPFADLDETLFRTLSLQLVEEYFDSSGSLATISESLKARYQLAESVNHGFAERIRIYCKADADKNAIAALDVFVQMFQFQAETEFGSIRRLFA